MPLPRTGEDGFEIGVLGLPAEGRRGTFGASDEAGGVSVAARLDFDGDWVAGDFAGGFFMGSSLMNAEVRF